MNKKKQPLLDDEDFMVYELDYTGKRIKLDIRPEELQIYSNPERVLIIIIKKIFHRIYIWNGSESQLRNKIISSRVAQDIQRDLNQKDRDYKIISIDQGSEPSKFFEFLKVEFGPNIEMFKEAFKEIAFSIHRFVPVFCVVIGYILWQLTGNISFMYIVGTYGLSLFAC